MAPGGGDELKKREAKLLHAQDTFERLNSKLVEALLRPAMRASKSPVCLCVCVCVLAVWRVCLAVAQDMLTVRQSRSEFMQDQFRILLKTVMKMFHSVAQVLQHACTSLPAPVWPCRAST